MIRRIKEDISDQDTRTMTIQIQSGISADGFRVIITDDLTGEIVHKGDYAYGYVVSYDKRWASPTAPYVTDLVEDLIDTYDVSSIQVTAGKNYFKNQEVLDKKVTAFKDQYLKGLSIPVH